MDTANLVEKTRQKLIADYGKNEIVVENGLKIKKVNAYLNAFDRFSKIIFEFAKNLNFDLSLYENELSALFTFCYESQSEDVNKMAQILESKNRILKASNFRIYYRKLNKFMQDIAEICGQKNSSFARISVAFSNNFGNTFSPSGEYDNMRNKLIAHRYKQY